MTDEACQDVSARERRKSTRHDAQGAAKQTAVTTLSLFIIMSTPPLEAERKAFSETVDALAPDMPLLMHGSGDVTPSKVNPDAAALVTKLTVQYISELVDAAVDAHDVLTDGAGGVLPPPPPLANNKRQQPPPSSSAVTRNNKRRKKANTDYWDEPLPEPKIKSSEPVETKPVTADEWVGVAGVDFWQDARSRRAHVSAPSAIGTQCFIFPICHDAGLYGRVMEVQAARRNIAPALMDSVMLDMVNAEGGRLVSATRKSRTATPSNDADNIEDAEEEDEENDEAELLPTWPGMESLLPVHRKEA